MPSLPQQFTSLGSQIGDTRPISVVRFSPGTSTPEGSGRLLAAGSWSGSVKLWEVPAAKERATLRGE
jgi:U4/U6 small nuclear ribonucleoprotein PRP4